MPTPNISPDKMDFDEDNKQYKVTPRRNAERRSSSPRRTTRPKPVTHDDIRALRGLDEKALIALRAGERRQQDRRTSRPKLLNMDEIVILRKT